MNENIGRLKSPIFMTRINITQSLINNQYGCNEHISTKEDFPISEIDERVVIRKTIKA